MTEKTKRNKKERRRIVKEAEFKMAHYWQVCPRCKGTGKYPTVGGAIQSRRPLWAVDSEDSCVRCDAKGGWWCEKATNRLLGVYTAD